MKHRLIPSLGLLAILLAFATPVLAHRPMWGESLGPIEVDDISISYAYYQTLKADEVDVFYFEGGKGENFHAGIQIPDVSKYKGYSVNIALFGPGLPTVEGEAQLPPEHPENLGALIVESKTDKDFFEPFTQTNYLGRQNIDITLPEDGLYYLVIWQPDGTAGKYVVDIGHKEKFGLLDLFLFPIWWLRVHWYFEHYVLVIISLVLFIGAVGYLGYRSRKGKSNAN